MTMYWYVFIHADVYSRHYLVCCRDGSYRGNNHTRRLTKEKRPVQKMSRKIGQSHVPEYNRTAHKKDQYVVRMGHPVRGHLYYMHILELPGVTLRLLFVFLLTVLEPSCVTLKTAVCVATDYCIGYC